MRAMLVWSVGLLPLLCFGGFAAAEELANGDFAAAFDSAWWTDGSVVPALRDGVACTEVPAATVNPWDAGIGQDGIGIEAGRAYSFSFRASGAPSGQVRATIQMPVEPWTSFVEISTALGPEMAAYSAEFTVPQSVSDGQLAFQFGGVPGAWIFCLDDVSVSEVAAPAEAAEPGLPRVRVNQLGYLPDGPKRATIVTEAPQPLDFVLKDELGEDVFAGRTVPRGFDPSAGLTVHVADFSAFEGAGEGFTLVADMDASFPFAIDPQLYDRLRIDALSYFYSARSGAEIREEFAGEGYGRPAGHLSRPGGGSPNQGDLDVPCQSPESSLLAYGEPWTCDYTLDAVQGWYDAGDYGKYVVNGGIAVAQLMAAHARAANIDDFVAPRAEALAALGDGSLRIPEAGNGLPDILDEALWELQFFLEMAVPWREPLAGMVHHKLHGSDWTDIPLLPHLDPEKRELHRPSTAATLNVAASMAQAARVYDPSGSAFPSAALIAAEEAFAAAVANPAMFAPRADQIGGGPYADDNVDDEFYWAAAELFITTGKSEYLDFLRASPWWSEDPFSAQGGDWNQVQSFARLQLATNPGNLSEADAAMIQDSVFEAADRYLETQAGQPFGHPYAPDGGHYDWGSNHLVIQIALVLATAYDLSGEERFRAGALEAMDYILGRNALNQSYITGYGTNYSRNQHSAWLAPSLDPALPPPVVGTLAGGPDSYLEDDYVAQVFAETGCAPQACYVDDVRSWSTNELAINWNAALAQFAAWLADQ